MTRAACTGLLVIALSAPSAFSPSAAAQFRVITSTPSQTLTAATGTSITVFFNEPVDTETITNDSFWAFGRWSGTKTGSFDFQGADKGVTFMPDEPFAAGEMVLVVLSHDIASAKGESLRDGGYSWQFWTRAQPAALDFALLDELTTNDKGGQSSQPYGGIGSDLDNDGWLDIAIVNEITQDLRVFMNTADGTGMLEPFLEPAPPLNAFASPSEPADFDRDGNTDMVVSNQGSNTVSVMMGNGDGTFDANEIATGALPNGNAVLDADGDGDIDFVNCNVNGSNLAIFMNDGTGNFAAPAFFDAGVPGERALAAADMNEDGILDLVVGTRTAPTSRVVVMRGNGDGTFTALSTTDVPGSIWMLVVGDVSNDGHVDVTIVSGAFVEQNEGGILLGDGAGHLAAPTFYDVDRWPVATDLGDMDGDGDLDWITSSFSGDFLLFLNDGTGTYTFEREFDALLSGSCALVMDLDNDRDVDLAFIDETADVLITYKNSGTMTGDLDTDGDVDFNDLLLLLAAWGPCGSCPEDLDGDGTVGFADLLLLLANWT